MGASFPILHRLSAPGGSADRREGAAPRSDEKACLRFCRRWLTGGLCPAVIASKPAAANQARAGCGRLGGGGTQCPGGLDSVATAPLTRAPRLSALHFSAPANLCGVKGAPRCTAAAQTASVRPDPGWAARQATAHGIYYPYEISNMLSASRPDFGASVSPWIIRTPAAGLFEGDRGKQRPDRRQPPAPVTPDDMPPA